MDTPRYSHPLVSIGMPAYNGARYIRKALDSLLAQDYDNFELIISDNASTDATLDICKEYADTDNRVKIHEQTHNLGALANFKTVLDLARGKYFMWAAVDDYWFPTFISEMVEELGKCSGAGVAMSAVDRVWENGDPLDTIRFPGSDNPNHRTYYQMLKSLTSRKKYNLYIYGLFRTQLLKKAMQVVPEVPVLDRLLICQLALATKFRYRDKVLHVRLHHRQPSNIRLPNEKYNKILNEGRWAYTRIIVAMTKMLYRSTVIPWFRKGYLPVAIWRFSWLLFFKKCRKFLSKMMQWLSALIPVRRGTKGPE